MEGIASGVPLPGTLQAIVDLIESASPEIVASILLLDDDGLHVRHGAAGRLPAAFCRAIDGQPIGPRAGSCGTAMHFGRPVVVTDIARDPLWANYRAAAAAHRLRACWSTPIVDSQRRVLGSFALYFHTPKRPGVHHRRLIELATHTASIAILKERAEREREQLLRNLRERAKEATLLHRSAGLLERERAVGSGLLAKLAELIPEGWQHPERCGARIRFGRLQAASPGWKESPWKLACPFRTADGVEGVVEVSYASPAQEALADPFLPEERQLIRSLADMLVARLERDRALAALRGSEAVFRMIFQNAAVGMTLTDLQGRILKCNPALTRMLGYSTEELAGRNFAEITYPDDIAANQDLYRALVEGRTDRFQMEKRYLRKDGAVVWTQLSVSKAPLDGGEQYTIGMMEDITERKRYESRIEYLATHDGLTDLPNRTLIHDRITQSIAHARRSERQIGVMYVDLDRFKVLNDGFGHPFGDAVLKAAGRRIAALLRTDDTVARQSGDEFVVLLSDLRKPTDAYLVARKLLDAFAAPITVEGRDVHLQASIGVSLFPQDGESAEKLIGNADVAMYRAKQLGGNGFQFFTREMSEDALRRVEIETQLRGAIARGELHLAYQPKVELASGRITGCEALVRWTHPALGAVSPGRFIPIAEDSGIIVPIGDWVLRSACAQAKAWAEAGLPPLVVSVNLSTRQFLQQDVAAWALEALADTGLAPSHLELELTESLIAQDVDKVIDTINRLKDAGAKLSIDDFGTGYSSLSYLKRFRVDTLKIDQAFVRNMLTEKDDATIVRAVISLGHSLGFRVIAEGVETAAHCDFLRANGCDQIQGYYFSKPVPAAEMESMLRSDRRLPNAVFA